MVYVYVSLRPHLYHKWRREVKGFRSLQWFPVCCPNFPSLRVSCPCPLFVLAFFVLVMMRTKDRRRQTALEDRARISWSVSFLSVVRVRYLSFDISPQTSNLRLSLPFPTAALQHRITLAPGNQANELFNDGPTVSLRSWGNSRNSYALTSARFCGPFP